jgi:hypothetical protein
MRSRALALADGGPNMSFYYLQIAFRKNTFFIFFVHFKGGEGPRLFAAEESPCECEYFRLSF